MSWLPLHAWCLPMMAHCRTGRWNVWSETPSNEKSADGWTGKTKQGLLHMSNVMHDDLDVSSQVMRCCHMQLCSVVRLVCLFLPLLPPSPLPPSLSTHTHTHTWHTPLLGWLYLLILFTIFSGTVAQFSFTFSQEDILSFTFCNHPFVLLCFLQYCSLIRVHYSSWSHFRLKK